MIWIGIDPGLQGALVALDEDSSLLLSRRTPLISGGGRKDYDVRAMRELLLAVTAPVSVAIELVRPMPRRGAAGPDGAAVLHKMGAASAFGMGRGHALWWGLAVGLDLPVHDVPPQRWAALLDGLPRGAAIKASAVARARALWPGLPIRAKADWAMADAALIAEAARRASLGLARASA